MLKYLGTNVEHSSPARVLNPNLTAAPPKEMDTPYFQGATVNSGHWCRYRYSTANTAHPLDILDGCKARSGPRTLVYPEASRIVTVPHASCDLEWSFSDGKRLPPNTRLYAEAHAHTRRMHQFHLLRTVRAP